VVPDFNPATILGNTSYYQEMIAVENWFQAGQNAKKNLGLFSKFFDPQKPRFDKSRTGCNNHFANKDQKLS